MKNVYNKKKTELLGMPFGTACNRLRKSIIFSLVKELKKDVCFYCKNKIKTIEELSIEHKTSWQNSKNPIELFFDLNNIAFSHLKCNVSNKYRKVIHGARRYDYAKCRCKVCIKANTKKVNKYRKNKNGRLTQKRRVQVLHT